MFVFRSAFMVIAIIKHFAPAKGKTNITVYQQGKIIDDTHFEETSREKITTGKGTVLGHFSTNSSCIYNAKEEINSLQYPFLLY